MAEALFVVLALVGGLSVMFAALAFLVDMILPSHDPVRDRIEAIKAMRPQATYRRPKP